MVKGKKVKILNLKKPQPKKPSPVGRAEELGYGSRKSRGPKKLVRQGIPLIKRPLLGKPPRTRLKVIGIGGGGSSIVAGLALSLRGIDFMAVNTDQQALNVLPANIKRFQLGQDLTRGLGTGMNAKIGEDAAKEAKEDIKKILGRVDFCILVACLGGGTGSGASPVFAEASREAGKVTLGIFTLPFSFEGEKRAKIAKEALKRLKQHLDGFVLLSNEKVFGLIDKEASLQRAFFTINEILADGLRGLIETIYLPGLINIDFADLKTILDFSPAPMLIDERGGQPPKKGTRARLLYLHSVLTGTESRAGEAVKEVFSNPLEDYDMEGADRILFNIAGPNDLKMAEVEKISTNICGLNRNARIIFGISRMPKLKDKLRLTVLATKAEEKGKKAKKQESKKTRRQKKQETEKVKPHSPDKVEISLREEETQAEGLTNGGTGSGSRVAVNFTATRLPLSANEVKKKEKTKKTGKTEQKKEKKKFIEKKKSKEVEKNQLPEKASEKASEEVSKADSLYASERKIKGEENQLLEKVQKEGSTEEKKVRRNGLELKRLAEEMEKEIRRQEEIWETPAFLRKKSDHV